jgi:tetratricopeptide (TPR) repeat protein
MPSLEDALHLLETGRPDQAASLLEALTFEHPEDPDVWTRLGQAHNGCNARQEAVIAFKRAVHLDPADAAAWLGMGVAYGHLNRHELAIEAFRRAIELGDPGAQASLNLARALTLCGRHEEAIALARSTRQRLPDHAMALLGLALALDAWSADGGNPNALDTAQQARIAYGGFIDAFPDSPWADQANDARMRLGLRVAEGDALPLREDVMVWLHDALETFDKLEAAAGSRAGFAPVVFEIVSLWQNGELDDPAGRHMLASVLGRQFGRDELMAWLYAGEQRLTISVDLPVDHWREFAAVEHRRRQG